VSAAAVSRHLLRRGTYFDSLVLMRLQQALAALPGVAEAAAMMTTAANREILVAGGLWPAELDGSGVEGGGEAKPPRPDDLLVVVRGDDAAAAQAALGRVDELLAQRSEAVAAEYRYRSLAAALRRHTEARWVSISVPGAHAAAVAEEALDAGRHVFLYSDNVPLGDEIALKDKARRAGLLLLGPDCGTAAVGGVGLGFCNRLRWAAAGEAAAGADTGAGAVGLVGASGTGLQAIACGVDERGGTVSHLIGTGGRDLKAEVGASATLRGLDLLDRDPGTAVVVLVSKPPAPRVAARVLARALAASKPVVVYLQGAAGGVPELGPVRFAASLEHAAELAVELAAGGGSHELGELPPPGFVRGLFCGGTLALEVALGLRAWLHPLATNLDLDGTETLADPHRSSGHCVVDLGADELTVGRPHPMIDPEPRDRRFVAEAADPDVGLLLLDVVLGDGAHPDPAASLAPALERALAAARRDGRRLEVMALLVGSDGDPQGLGEQTAVLTRAGARVTRRPGDLVRYAARAAFAATVRAENASSQAAEPVPEVPLSALQRPAVVNVGLEAFAASLVDQGARAVQVDWRPPAGGDDKLAAILRRMKG